MYSLAIYSFLMSALDHFIQGLLYSINHLEQSLACFDIAQVPIRLSVFGFSKRILATNHRIDALLHPELG